MNKYTLIIVIFCFSFMVSCDVIDKNSKPTAAFVFPSETQDTLIYINSGELNLPVFLHIPACGTRPLPAIVIMHGSGGMWANNVPGSELSPQFDSWKDILDNECIISAFVDSYSPRGVAENEGEYKIPPKTFEISAQFERPKDAFATVDYLWLIKPEGTDGFLVNKSKVGLLGFSHGGTAVESTVFDPELVPENWNWQQSFNGITYDVEPPFPKPEITRFAAAVAYYPGSFHNGYYGNVCNESGSYYMNYSPLLLQLAELDPLTDNSLCFVNSTINNNGLIEYIIYEGAGHSFDNQTSGADGLASDQARMKTIEWFKVHLKL